jgi:hypothetical protein
MNWRLVHFLQLHSKNAFDHKISLGVGLLALLLIGGCCTILSRADSQLPVYAIQGAYVYYNVQGGSIAFMSGVNGSLIYKVTDVFPNNTMTLQVLANMTQGDEVPTSYQVLNYTDNVFDPTIFPAVSASNLSTNSFVVFENVRCSFVKYENVSLSQGQYNTSEYKGTDKNGTVYNFFFDRSTGVAVQMYSTSGAALQLASSNIVAPDGPANVTSQALPYYEDFGAAFAFSALIFGGAYWYYRSKNKKLAVSKANGES